MSEKVFVTIVPYLSNPFVLIGLAVFLFFGLQHALIKSGLIKPLSKRASSNIAQLLIKYAFILSLLTVIFGFILTYIKTNESRSIIKMTRVDAERFIQRNRGSIERCINNYSDWYYLDFIFTEKNSVINIDIVPGKLIARDYYNPAYIALPHGIYKGTEVMGRLDTNFLKKWDSRTLYVFIGVHPNISYVEPKKKLSATHPNVNYCIIDILAEDIKKYSVITAEKGVGLKFENMLVHRYLTDKGCMALK